MTTPDAYAALDAEETRLLTQLAEVRAAKATLRRVLGVAEPPHGPLTAAEEPAEGKSAPAPVQPKPPGRAPDLARPLRIARLLAAKPMSTDELSKAVGSAPSTVAADLVSPRYRAWFRKVGNHVSPWTLTEAGRAAAAAPPPVAG